MILLKIYFFKYYSLLKSKIILSRFIKKIYYCIYYFKCNKLLINIQNDL